MNAAQNPLDSPAMLSPDPCSMSASVDPDRSLSAYDYQLPSCYIAQSPAEPRDSARLLVVQSHTDHGHHIFHELPQLLRAGDLLILNNTQVISARLYGRKIGGAAVELLLLEERSPRQWLALVKPGRRLKPGARIQFARQQQNQRLPADTAIGLELKVVTATVMASDPETKGRLIEFDLPAGQRLPSILAELGDLPLPPYITNLEIDPARYQTVYGDRPGAVAAPTAGLHFTSDLLNQLQQHDIRHAFVTLHVGVGTFRPVEVEDITTHTLHGEWVEVPAATVAAIRHTQAQGGRVIAVGTTAVRALEAAAQDEEIQPYCGKTNLFIYPGYRWRVIDGLITNFHLPKSSLLMLVSALIGRDRLLTLYQEAIAQQYRFYSFGDAMLILPAACLDSRELSS